MSKPGGTEDQWDCAAYGPGAREAGALCFVSELHKRACASREVCAQEVTAERQRVFQRISELAAQGDPTAVFLAGEFTSPDQILGGDGNAG